MLALDAVWVLDSGIWKVQSQSEPNEYTVQQITEKCSENCGIRCKECNICVHLYSCSCPDSILQHTICKHVHLVAQYRQQDDLPSVEDTLNNVLIQDITTQKQSANYESVQSKIMVLLNDISSLVKSSTNFEDLKMVEKKLITIKSGLTASVIEVSSIYPTVSEPSNKNVEKQRSFQSFKKKRARKICFGNP